MSLESIYIVGAGGLGKEILGLLFAINDHSMRWDIMGFYDDSTTASGFKEVPLLGTIEELKSNENASNVVVAIGNPLIKQQVVKRLGGKHFPTLIHPSSTILMSDEVKLGEGTVICAGSCITTSVSLGRFNLINLNATIGHDSILEDYVSVMPGVNIAGGIHVESGVLIGSGANLINNVKIGMNAVVGAGAVVTRDVPSGLTVAGIPARKLGSDD